MAVSDKPFYEIPPELQKMAEKNVEQVKQAFDQFVGAARQAVKSAESQMETAMSGAKDVRSTALKMAEQNIASSFAFAQQLLTARDPQDVVQMHSEFVKSQMGTLSEQAQELTRKATKMADGKAT
ncbi:MAG: phasin family protein [Pseudolabrys sp.]